MATATNASKAKKALLTLVGNILGANPDTDTVEVNYAFNAREGAGREQVHLGHAEGTQEYATMGRRPRLARDENLTIKLHIVVRRPGDEQVEAEERCAEIGTVIEEALAVPLNTAGIDGLTQAGITGVFLDGDADDDGSFGYLSYDVEVISRLT